MGPGDDRPLVAELEGLTQDNARTAVSRLEHLARWTQTARLTNPVSTIKPVDFKISVLVGGKDVVAREIPLEYQLVKERKWAAPQFTLSLTNTSGRTLYFAILDLTETFKIDAGLMAAGHVRLRAGETFWALNGDPIEASVPDELWEQGVIEYKDILKVFLCTQPFDARLLEQPALDLPVQTKGTRSLPRDSTLNRLMRQVRTREFRPARAGAIDDWQASEVVFTTVRPLDGTGVPAPGAAALLTAGVQMHGHPSFRATARLATTPLASRDLNDLKLPRLLLDSPADSRPLALAASRGTEPELSVLELIDVKSPEAVTPDTPLRLTIPVALGRAEHVLPIASDGELFLPLGRVAVRSPSSTEIVLERLPPPLVDRRSLRGAIKIFFQKVVSHVFGSDFPYPLLAAADVAADGTISSTAEPAQVRPRVASARRIALVHGIIGDTRTMPAVQLARLANGQPLASRYDLVLSFDYENLNTTIEENGRLLKRRLADVGLGEGHTKELEIIAHSMGGMVSRWFIEREGGNKVVRRLIMFGTPNGGSPWPRVADWALIALGAGLNNLTATPWPAKILGSLSALIESPTVALSQMAPGSSFIKELAASPDPGIPVERAERLARPAAQLHLGSSK
jgi:hypothetical protein